MLTPSELQAQKMAYRPDMTLEEREVHAYKGVLVRSYISEVFKSLGPLAAKEHTEALNKLGFFEASGSLAECMEEENDPTLSNEIFLYRKLHAESNRMYAEKSAFDIATSIDPDCNTPESIRWVRRAAELGHEESAQALGTYLLTVDVTPENILEGIRWYFRSLSMEVMESWYFDHSDDPVERDFGWTDWDFLGRLISEQPTDTAIEIAVLVATEHKKYLQTLTAPPKAREKWPRRQ